tara:strand:+ start:14128 stop:14658 length:531 start_codon:yes stop_codon:yes gene_type:complete
MITFKETLSDIKNDLPKKSLISFIRNYFLNPSFRVLLNYRLGKYFFYSRLVFSKQLSEFYRYRLITKRGCDISYKSTLGKGIIFPHPLGIVIGVGVVVGDNVVVFQQVTLGSHGKSDSDVSYPVVRNSVKIYAGAKIIGGITIGRNSIVGANSLINKNVPSNSVAYGTPCKIKEIY